MRLEINRDSMKQSFPVSGKVNLLEKCTALLGNNDYAYEVDDYEFVVILICLVFSSNSHLHGGRQLKRQMVRFNQCITQSSINSRRQLWLN